VIADSERLRAIHQPPHGPLRTGWIRTLDEQTNPELSADQKVQSEATDPITVEAPYDVDCVPRKFEYDPLDILRRSSVTQVRVAQITLGPAHSPPFSGKLFLGNIGHFVDTTGKCSYMCRLVHANHSLPKGNLHNF